MSVTPASTPTTDPEPARAPARSRAATRQRILESAQALFAARGVHAVTSHDIAGEAGVAAGTFYNHFKDKHALFGEIVRDTVARLRERLERAGGDETDRPRRVRRRAEALVAFTQENRDLVRILFGRDRDGARLGEDVLDQLAGWVEAEIRVHNESPRRPPELVAQAIVGMWARTLSWWAEQPDRSTPEMMVGALVDLQLGGTSGALVDPPSARPKENRP